MPATAICCPLPSTSIFWGLSPGLLLGAISATTIFLKGAFVRNGIARFGGNPQARQPFGLDRGGGTRACRRARKSRIALSAEQELFAPFLVLQRDFNSRRPGVFRFVA